MKKQFSMLLRTPKAVELEYHLDNPHILFFPV